MNDNQRAIAPVTTWLNGESKTMTILKLDNYQGYNFLDSPGYVNYVLQDADSNGILAGTVNLTWPLVEAWGMDDQPIFNYVATELNLQLI